jgi:hypothetical protein
MAYRLSSKRWSVALWVNKLPGEEYLGPCNVGAPRT